MDRAMRLSNSYSGVTVHRVGSSLVKIATKCTSGSMMVSCHRIGGGRRTALVSRNGQEIMTSQHH